MKRRMDVHLTRPWHIAQSDDSTTQSNGTKYETGPSEGCAIGKGVKVEEQAGGIKCTSRRWKKK
jgi:hypothetical protein